MTKSRMLTKNISGIWLGMASVIPRVSLDISVYIPTLYFSGTEGPPTWFWAQSEIFKYNLKYLDWLKMHCPAWSKDFSETLLYLVSIFGLPYQFSSTKLHLGATLMEFHFP